MIVGVGTDLVDLERFRTTLDRRPGLVDRLFTAGERDYAQLRTDPTERLAVRFATKEAVMKAMGVGIGAVDWHDIEVVRADGGQPSVVLHGRAASLADRLGIGSWQLTLSHSDLVAQATAVALAPGAPQWSANGPAASNSGDRVGAALPSPGRFGFDPIDGGGPVPIVTPAEMGAIDADAPEPVEELISRAGAAVARTAIRMMGGTYGRRVVVLAGKGNNGNDGREAARRLSARGVRVTVLDAARFANDADGVPGSDDASGSTSTDASTSPDANLDAFPDAAASLPDCDLVIDAAYGTGFRGSWSAPSPPPGALVLAVDIPSGIDGVTGRADGPVMVADATVTFAALKPGLVMGDGLAHGGEVVVADIGLDVSRASAHLVGAALVASWLPDAPSDAHKWLDAVWVVAGSPGMGGAAALCTSAAARTGAGYVRISTPGGPADELPIEAVRVDLARTEWSSEVVAGLDRFGALVIGNGLGTSDRDEHDTAEQIRRTVAAAAGRSLPTVVDADALTALGLDAARFVGPTTILTPHDGEYARLAGHAPGADRLDAARSLASTTGAVVLLKGRTTVVAAPGGEAFVSIAGDQRLATAGTGDVLAGIIGALLARGLDPLRAGAAAAFLHGRAGALGWRRGLVAGDVVAHLPAVLDALALLRP